MPRPSHSTTARRMLVGAGLALFVATTGACGSDSASAVKVVSTNTKCTTERREFSPGKQTFEVFNQGSEPTELYVLKGDSVLGEVENVGPGTSRTVTVDLKSGTFDLGCKPGQTGPFIRQPITVSGATSDEQGAPAAREIDFNAVDFDYDIDLGNIEAGQRIAFAMTNDGKAEHEFEVLAPGGDPIGEIAPTEPGQTAKATLEFDRPGTYTYICAIDDHAKRGMKGEFTVR